MAYDNLGETIFWPRPRGPTLANANGAVSVENSDQKTVRFFDPVQRKQTGGTKKWAQKTVPDSAPVGPQKARIFTGFQDRDRVNSMGPETISKIPWGSFSRPVPTLVFIHVTIFSRNADNVHPPPQTTSDSQSTRDRRPRTVQTGVMVRAQAPSTFSEA